MPSPSSINLKKKDLISCEELKIPVLCLLVDKVEKQQLKIQPFQLRL